MSDEISLNTDESNEVVTAATSEPTIEDLQNQITAVSYTHLTLPTILRV